ncbi:TetR/AcrR family transcriptional regulator [Noviherbaspirillum saxi]|uniref:TetR family transcriptional regulator n=1 Tax=Noviherbaspirillum saxi TaxID=2320863 RepID=A0A3A3FT18_9BURK|nr:TetR/AcrR family transcriptional regulator C-terminal domain-containing protein [Noviherbaspirillum saxi]RJF99196.1 TetR family transcriptional regulator [Noviherbaspirillum saxi]
MARPAKFSRDQLQSAALALVDEHGLNGLSMRALAGALGTGAMTLYNYVNEREGLDLLVVEAVISEAQWSLSDDEDWQDQVRIIATALWCAVRAHPNAIPLILTRRSRSPAVLKAAEALLTALAGSGRTSQSLLVAFRAISALVMGFAQADLAGPLALKAGESSEATIARFQALPSEQYPRLIEIAAAAMTSHSETEFQAGLDLLLAGILASQ